MPEDGERDELLAVRCEALQFVRPQHLEIAEGVARDDALDQAARELNRMNSYKVGAAVLRLRQCVWCALCLCARMCACLRARCLPVCVWVGGCVGGWVGVFVHAILCVRGGRRPVLLGGGGGGGGGGGRPRVCACHFVCD